MFLQCFDHPNPKYCSCPCFMIKGYDTSLSNKAIEKAARKHFSSCGTVSRISILRRFCGFFPPFFFKLFYALNSRLLSLLFVDFFFNSTGAALVFIVGEQAAEKALELGAFYIRGREVVAKLVSAQINPTFHTHVISGRRCFQQPPGTQICFLLLGSCFLLLGNKVKDFFVVYI